MTVTAVELHGQADETLFFVRFTLFTPFLMGREAIELISDRCSIVGFEACEAIEVRCNSGDLT